MESPIDFGFIKATSHFMGLCSILLNVPATILKRIMSHQTWDLGEIIKNHVYIREIYSTNLKDKCLFSSRDFLTKLGRLYDYLGIKWKGSQEINIKIKLPNSHNPVYRDYWNETSIRNLDERTSITKVNRFSRYYKKEVVFASSAWLGEFESFPGDEIVISPLPSVKRISSF
jgi:hypothetical protein